MAAVVVQRDRSGVQTESITRDGAAHRTAQGGVLGNCIAVVHLGGVAHDGGGRRQHLGCDESGCVRDHWL